MTLRELQNEICDLGFDEYSTPPDTALLFAARRALSAIYSELPITAKASIFISPKTPLTLVKSFHHEGGRVESLPLKGKTFTLTVSGKGSILIDDGQNTQTIAFDTERQVLNGFLNGDGYVSFEGKYSYDVYNIATYSESYSDEHRMIPNVESRITVNVRDHLSDFLSFASHVSDSDGNIICATLQGEEIILPSDFCGEIKFTYRRLPKPPTLAEPDESLDIPKCYESLLPLLAAFYILLDDETEQAEIYLRMYREEVASLKKCSFASKNNGYADVTGWAR